MTAIELINELKALIDAGKISGNEEIGIIDSYSETSEEYFSSFDMIVCDNENNEITLY